MATNKNQHFVPRCYFRPFSRDAAGRVINLFNIDRNVLIKNAPVRHQCSGDYFYGQDANLEKGIQAIEGYYATILPRVVSHPFKLTDFDRLIIRRFWLLQYLRTEASSRRAAEMMSGMGSYTGIEANHFRLEIRDAVLTAMSLFANEMEIIDDLKVCIIRNKSKMPFITSDDPAILTNRWHLQNARTSHRSFGLGSSGAVFLLPLSPKFLAVGYDGDVYSIPHNNGYVQVSVPEEVAALNEHQFLTCRANIFSPPELEETSIQEAYAKVAPIRPKVRHRYNYAVLDSIHTGYKRYAVVDPSGDERPSEAIIHAQVIHPRPNIWPKFLQQRLNGRVYTNGSGAGYVRRVEAARRGTNDFRIERV